MENALTFEEFLDNPTPIELVPRADSLLDIVGVPPLADPDVCFATNNTD